MYGNTPTTDNAAKKIILRPIASPDTMSATLPIIISASRRTDIPAFYLPWFFDSLAKGGFEVVNPYNRQVHWVPAAPQKVHTFVFWSKNFAPFIDARAGERLMDDGYHLFFNFTINSQVPLLEPHVPPLSQRLLQLERLCRRFDPAWITWRFDPICFYTTASGQWQHNLHDFTVIARAVAQCGIRRCVTSFRDAYRKIAKRVARHKGLTLKDPPMSEKIALISDMAGQLKDLGIGLQTCCEKDVQKVLPKDGSVTRAACISSELLMALFGGNLSLKPDVGQRQKSGCGCQKSVDIGSYHLHPCYHDCLFCYANPACDGLAKPAATEQTR
jgi:hypothetical protein